MRAPLEPDSSGCQSFMANNGNWCFSHPNRSQTIEFEWIQIGLEQVSARSEHFGSQALWQIVLAVDRLGQLEGANLAGSDWLGQQVSRWIA